MKMPGSSADRNMISSSHSAAKPRSHPAPARASRKSVSIGKILDRPRLEGGCAILDLENKIISVNDALALWLGASRGELQGQAFPAVVGQRFPEWKKPLREFLTRPAAFDRRELITKNERSQIAIELCSHQQTRFVRMESVLPPANDLDEMSPEPDWAGATTHAVFNRRVRGETQANNLAQRWPGIIFSQRPDFSFASVNPRIEEFTGLSPREWRHAGHFQKILHEADAEALLQRIAQMDGSPDGMTSTFRIRHIQTGRVTYLWEHRQPVRSNDGTLRGYEGIWLDITRQTVAERRLLNMSWKENLGTLSMGLAHDFCNMMTGIVGLSETFENEFKENQPLRNGLGLIRKTALQASDLAHRIRQLHQGKPGEKNFHDLNAVARELVEVLKKVLNRAVRIQSELAPGQLPIHADAVQLRQVIVNLALNAADAMPNGGSLTFRTSLHHQAPSTRLALGDFPRLPLICLTVQDSGTGISPDDLNSIFDPFFTTKPPGKGSGLGLYNARLFAESHGVAISVETREQAGTAFHLWFPQTDFSEAPSTPQVSSPVRHTLLVAGQSGAARDRMVELLRSNGFYVVPAAPNHDALRSLQSSEYNFSGAIMLCSRARDEQLPLLQHIDSEKLPIKTFLSAVGCHDDELETSLLKRADALLPQDLPASELVARIRSVLARH
jgi:PAS domain S-box-containing protein